MRTNYLAHTFSHNHTQRYFVVIAFLVIAVLLARPTTSASAQSALSGLVTWTGQGFDARWSNPANWDTGRVPGSTDIAHFAGPSTIAIVDAKFDGTVAGLQLDADFKGLVRLDRPLSIMGDLILRGGMLDGSSGQLWVKDTVQVSDGLLVTPHTSLRANAMDIQAPGLVRLSASSRLTLADDGMPLTGNGVLDTATNRPNTVEFTGHSTGNVSNARPLMAMRALNLSKRSFQQALAAGLPQAPDLTSSYITTSGTWLSAAVIDTANGLAYFCSKFSPNVLSKINLATGLESAFVTLPGSTQITSGVLDTTRGYAYFGGDDGVGGSGAILKVNVAPAGFAYSNTLALGTTGTFLYAAVIDPAGGAAYFGGILNSVQGGIFKISLTTTAPTLLATVPLPTGEESPTSAVIDTVNQAAYFGVTDILVNYGNVSVVKIALSPVFTRTAATPLAGLTSLDSAVIDQAAGLAYFGGASYDGFTPSPPVNVVKVQLSPISVTAPISVATIQPFSTITWTLDQVKAAFIDTSSGFAYFAGSDSLAGSPTVVAKVKLSTFTPLEWLPLSTVGENAISAVIDPGSHKAYLGLDSNRVAQLLLANSQVVVTSSTNPSVFGQSVTFTATVSALSGVAGRPTGTVTFTIDSSINVTRSLTAAGTSTSTATLVTTTLPVSAAPHSILVSYDGDATFTPTSGTLFQTVNKANTSTGLAVSTNPAVYGQPITLTATVTATSPGVGTPTGIVTFTLDGATTVTATLNASRVATYVTSTLNVATHPIAATYSGDGNFNISTSNAVNEVINRANTSTGLATSATPTVFGQPITFTAIVTATSPGAGTPTGTVTFTLDGGTNVTATLNASRVVTYVTSTLSVATHPVVATYGGDLSFNGSSSSTVNQVVNKADTTTSVTSSPNPSVFGQGVTFTATVLASAPGAGNPSGTVTFFDGAINIGSGTVGAGGLATATVSSLNVGTHAAITAQYSGDGSFNTSTSSAYSHVVNKANTTTSVTSSPNPSVFGQSVTFTATVLASVPGAGSPSGTVTFFDNGTSLGSGALGAGGLATLTTSSLSVNVHANITATYGSDASFNSSTSSAYSHTVNKADTTMSVTSAPNPSVFGQSVTFTAIVTASAPGAGTPTGIVTFTFDGGTSVTAALNGSRVATYVTSTLSVAAHPVATTYGGDGNFNTSSASLPTQTVNKANTTTSVTSSPNPSVFGQNVTFTATVAASAPGAGNPSGSVMFYDNGTSIGSSVIGAGGLATVATSALSVGAHSNITATYSGDASFNGSTSTAYLHTVNKAGTTTSVTSSPNPSVFGQSVTFTATVLVSAPGAGNPSGTVTFFDGATNIGSGTVGASGFATATVSSLSVGTHAAITAQYGGDGNFNGSASSAYSHLVNKANTTTSVTSSPNPSVFGQSVTFTATVAASAPGAGSPSGSVTFFDNATNIGTGSLNASGVAVIAISPLSVGAHASLTAQYNGDVNFNTSTSSAYLHTVNKANTTASVTAAPNPSVFGQSVTFTAIVTASAPGAGTPTGIVTFTFDGGTVVTAALNGSRVATYVTTTLGVAAHPVTAAYSGDGNFNTSSASLPTQTVNKANSTTTVTAAPNPSIFGQSVTFTATVAASAPGAGNPSGTVTFTIDAAPTSVALVNGVATLTTASLAVGGHSVSTAYSGDGNFNTSNGTLPTQTVNKASTTTSVASSVNPSIFGQSVTFTATIVVVAPGVGGPTGNVTFTIDGTPFVVASTGGVATYSTSALAVGPHSVSAAYGGDGSFNGSSGSLPTQTVNKTGTTTSLTSAPSASVFGQSVTFTATVAVVAPGSGNPSGTVTFLDNGSSIGTGPVGAGGIATLTTSTLAAGTHANLTASYAGDTSFNGSTSSAYSQSVNKAATTIAIIASAPSPSVYSETVTFTFTLNVNTPGNGTPTGVVTITDGAQLCTATLPASSCAITFNSVGAKSLNATYSGDVSFNPAVSGAFAHTVTARPPVANDDSYTILENGVLNVSAAGVLSNDVALNGRPITSTLLNGPITGTLIFSTNGSFTFTPTQYFNGVVTYTYQANDAGLVSNAATVTITVLSVNQPPSFTPGPDISVFTSTQFITDSWATNISVGPANESAQTVAFTVTTNNPNLFQIPPTVSPTGTLSFKPAPFYAGTAVATVFAQDNGGTANGGVDTSPSITFTIVISSDPDVPLNLMPGPQTTYINQAHVFSSGNGNAISVVDPDAAFLGEVLSVTLHATNGTLQLGSLAGLIVTPTTGVGAVVSFSGLITPTNAALNGLTFTPTNNFIGAAGIVIETQDLGHFGEPASFVVADSVDIAVIDTPITSVNAVNSSPTALGSTTFFTASQTGGSNVAYAWDFGDGNTGSGANTSHSYAAIGTYTAVVTASNPTNYLTATTTVTIEDAAIVSVTAFNNSPTVFGSSTQFTATQTGGTNVTYAWSFGDTTTGSGANPAHLYTGVGNYTAVVTATNGVSNKAATTPVVIIKATPTVAISTHLPDPSVVGQNVTVAWSVTPPGAGSATGTVTVTDGAQTCSAIVTAGQCIIAFSSPGTKTLTAQYSGDANFNSAASGSVLHAVNKADSTTNITVTGPALFGQVWPITVSVAAAAPGSGTPGGMITVTDGMASCLVALPGVSCNLTFNVLGSHVLTATYSGDANFNTSSATSPLNVVDVPVTNLSAGNSSPTRLDDTTFFTATANGTNSTYNWDFGDGSSIGSGPNVTHAYALSGTYTALVTATNSLSSQSATTAVTITNQRPLAVATDANFSVDSTVTLDGHLSTDPDNHYPLAYYWTQTGGSPTVSFTPDLSVTTFTAPSSPTVLTFTLTVTDAHGLPSLPKTVTITIANIPITGLAADNNSPTAFGIPTQFTATVSTGSSVNYTWNFGDGITTTGQFPAHTYGALGNYTAVVTAVNTLGTFTTTTPVTIIKATPVVLITSHTPDPAVVGQNVMIAFSVTPPGSYTPTGTVTVTAGTQSCSDQVAAGFCTIAFTTSGPKSLTATYSGDTNFNAAASVSVNHTVNPADTTTSAASTVNPSVFGQSVIFTATVAVSSPGSGTPTGSVAFTIDGVPVGSATLSGGVAAYVTSTLAVATHPVIATYSGDANFNGSTSGALDQIVNKANSSTNVTSSVNPSVFGQSVTFTATVLASAPGAGTPGGTVTMTIDGTPTVVALSGGTATLTTSSLAVGSHTVSAAYNGDGNFNASSGSLPTQVVNKADSTTTVISAPNPSVVSQTVTFTATVTASAPGAGGPSGVVTFTIDGSDVATATLSGGIATYSTSSLAVGPHPVSVAYSGDGNFNSGTGNLTQIVNKPASVTSVTSTPNASVFGQSVTFTATVVPAGFGPTPTGLVTFTIDGTPAGSVALSGGVASLSTAALSVADHPVVVTYGGDTNFNGSASNPYTQTVNKAGTATSVTSAPNPSVFGQSVTFTATVTVSAPGAGSPSGTVTFFDGVTNLGTGTVNAGGIATLSTSTLSVGAHPNITAQYGGDSSFNGSPSSATAQTVNKANSTTSVASSPNPSVFGQSVTFTATVVASAPGAGSPTGTVTFTIGGVTVVRPLSGGVATYVTSTLVVTSHSVSAAYSGDGNFNGSAASSINQVVNKAGTTTVVTSSQNPAPVTNLITFTASIAVTAPGAGLPTGVVTFTIDGVAVGAPAISGGVAIYSTSALTVGTHTVTATYGGDSSFNLSTGQLTPDQSISKYRTFLPIVRR